MGVSLYVMPFRTFLTGRFKTTWEGRQELAGGAPGLKSGALSDLDADAFVAGLRRSLEPLLGIRPDWDEGGDAASATSMSYSGIARPGDVAGRHPGRQDFGHVRRMQETFAWLPLEFKAVLEVADPLDPEHVLALGSAPTLAAELALLEQMLLGEPRAAELESLPEGSVITGMLSEFWDDLQTARHLLRVTTLAVERRLPMILDV